MNAHHPAEVRCRRSGALQRAAQLAAWVGLLAASGCASVPKPPELVAYEKLRRQALEPAQSTASAARTGRDRPEARSRESYRAAMEAWERGELELCRELARLATVQLRRYQVQRETAQSRQRLLSLEAELRRARSRLVVQQKQLREVEEWVSLHRELATARSSILEKDVEISETRQLADAQTKVSEAEQALMQAQTVAAARLAAQPYEQARTLLQRATAALERSDPVESAAAAAVALSKAKLALQTAQPAYSKEQAASNRQAQNDRLVREAMAIRGVIVKLRTVGPTQQLVLLLPRIFKGDTTVAEGGQHAIHAVATLLKEYSSYPVLVKGRGNPRLPASERRRIARARARHLKDILVGMKIPAERLAAIGEGTAARTNRGPAPSSERGEVVVLFQ